MINLKFLILTKLSKTDLSNKYGIIFYQTDIFSYKIDHIWRVKYRITFQNFEIILFGSYNLKNWLESHRNKLTKLFFWKKSNFMFKPTWTQYVKNNTENIGVIYPKAKIRIYKIIIANVRLDNIRTWNVEIWNRFSVKLFQHSTNYLWAKMLLNYFIPWTLILSFCLCNLQIRFVVQIDLVRHFRLLNRNQRKHDKILNE